MRITFNEKCQGANTQPNKSDYDIVISNTRVQALINAAVLKSKFLYVPQSTFPRARVPLRFIKFTLLATGQTVYGIECARVNFVSRTNGFPLFSQIANVRMYVRILRQMEKGLPHIVCQNVLSMSTTEFLSAWLMDFVWNLSLVTRNIFGRRIAEKDSDRYYVVNNGCCNIVCTSASYYVWYFGLPQHSWLPISE